MTPGEASKNAKLTLPKLLFYPFQDLDYPYHFAQMHQICCGRSTPAIRKRELKPIAFYSKKLNETQTRYSTYDRELLGIYLSVKHFKHLLEGNDFVIYTDHKPLTFAFKQKMKKHHQDNNDNFNTIQNLVVTFNMYWVKIMLLQMPYPELIQFLKSTLRKLQKSKLLTKSCKIIAQQFFKI
ncbi:transposon Tf2-9 polyprotein [Trichonephila clavipes]|nr:transposon Tf2-9 polyprotein [Trichonephila clavipes]